MRGSLSNRRKACSSAISSGFFGIIYGLRLKLAFVSRGRVRCGFAQTLRYVLFFRVCSRELAIFVEAVVALVGNTQPGYLTLFPNAFRLCLLLN